MSDEKIIKCCVGFQKSNDPKHPLYEINEVDYKELKFIIKNCGQNNVVCEWIDLLKDVRPYFDIDYKFKEIVSNEVLENKKNEYMDIIKDILSKEFGNSVNYAWDDSSGNEKDYSKISFHVIVHNIRVKGEWLQRWLKENNYFEKGDFKFDKTVYKNGAQKFRLPKTTKQGSLRKSKIIIGNLKDFIVQHPKIQNYPLHDRELKEIVKIEIKKQGKAVNSQGKAVNNQVKEIVKINNNIVENQMLTHNIGEGEEWLLLLKDIPSEIDYTKWFEITCAIKNIGAGDKYKNNWLIWCDSESKYDKNIENWNGIEINKYPYNIGTIKNYHKEYNPTEHAYKEFIRMPNHNLASDLYIMENKNFIKCVNKKNKAFWLYNEKTKLWSEEGGETFIKIVSNKLSKPINDIINDNKIKINKMMNETTKGLNEKNKKIAIKQALKEDEDLMELVAENKQSEKALQLVNSCNYATSIVKYIASDPEIYDEKFYFKITEKTDILAVNNGIVDLRTGILRPREYSDYCVNHLDSDYNKNANESEFSEFIRDLFDCPYYKKDLEDVIEYVQKMLGYAITKSNEETTGYLFIGDGSNGKSVLCNIIKSIFNPFVGNVDQTLLDKNSMKQNANSASEAVIALFNKSIGLCNEVEEDISLGGVFKNYCDNGTMTGRALYGSPFTFSITHKFIMNLNNMFYIPKNDEAVARRLICVKFENKYKHLDSSGNQPKGSKPINIKLESNLLKNKEGILKWFINGAIKYYQSNGLGDRPEIFDDIKNKTLDASDWTIGLEFTGNMKQMISHAELINHIQSRISKKITTKDIEKEMKRRGVVIKKRDGRNNYKGVLMEGREDSDDDIDYL